MTAIRVDAETLAKLKQGNGPIYLCDDTGTPVIKCVIAPSIVPDHEPELTDEEWDAIANDPVSYTLEEGWEKIRRGEAL